MTPSPPDPTIFQTLWVLEAHPRPLTSLESIFLELPPQVPPEWLLSEATDHIPTLGKNSLLFISSACSPGLEGDKKERQNHAYSLHLYPHCRKECVHAGDWQLGTYAWLVICLLFCYHHPANLDASGGGQGWFWQIITRLKSFQAWTQTWCGEGWAQEMMTRGTRKTQDSEVWLIRDMADQRSKTELWGDWTPLLPLSPSPHRISCPELRWEVTFQVSSLCLLR